MRAVLWDMDGTLVDSEEFHWLAWREAMANAGVTITRDDFLATFGWRNDAILPRWLGADVAAERRQRIGDAKEEHYRRLVRESGLSPLPGAAEWVRRLHADGWKQTIASSAPRANVEVILDVLDFTGKIDAIVAAEDVLHGKPAPDVFLAAARQVGVAPSRCVVVEDAPAGVEAGRRAGMRTIGVERSGKRLHADIVVASLDALPPNVFPELLGSGDPDELH